jgi:putative transposase
MKRSKFSEEQIVYTIRQAEAGTPVGDLCQQLYVRDATFYAWQKHYAHLGVSELRRLRQLEEKKTADKNDSWPTSRSTSTCCRRPCEKKSTARTPP